MAMALGRTGSMVGAYALIVPRRPPPCAEPHSVNHENPTRLLWTLGESLTFMPRAFRSKPVAQNPSRLFKKP
jgi:hypothetical protein